MTPVRILSALLVCSFGMLVGAGPSPALAAPASVPVPAPMSVQVSIPMRAVATPPWSRPALAEPSLPGSRPGPTEPSILSPIPVWAWPLAPPHPVLRQFEAPVTPYAAGHRGIDLPAQSGVDVYAPADGVVSFAGTVVDRPLLSITHPGDLVSSVEPVEATVAEGDRVVAGQLIGRVSSGGHCSGVCAHFGVRLHGEYVSPLLFLGGVPRAILLPLN